MGRRKGSTNKPKNGAGEDPHVTRHDNLAQEPLTDDQLEALTSSHAELYIKALAKKRTADAELQHIVKTAKADKIPLAEIKAYIDARTEEGQERLREQAERIRRMERWFKFATQADLFASGAEPAPVGNRSYRIGREAGLAGEKAAPPTDADIDTYMAGWRSGQTDMASVGIKQTPAADDFH